MHAQAKKPRKKLIGCGCLGVIVVVVGVAVAGAIGLSSVAGSTSTTARPLANTLSEDTSQEPAVFISVIDGDTIETDAGTVRIIGIDTPERGECGFATASSAITNMLSEGDEISLELPVGQNDTDRYDRLIRYVFTSGQDVGLMQLTEGNAIARFDSRDGYPEHPREAAYHGAQIASLDANGKVLTVECEADPNTVETTAPLPVVPDQTASSDRWWTQYPSCAALKRNTVGYPIGPFDVNNPEHALLYEWFAHQTGNRGDGDGDGLACE